MLDFKTLDHIIPITRGGADDTNNFISTSMLRNSAKATIFCRPNIADMI